MRIRATCLALTSWRRTAAEDGNFHRVARKLAALFWDGLPEVPALERAYGERATAIAMNPVVNPRGGKNDGAFQDLVGIDGTTIWAAATSGKGGIAVHLLACMLARIFKEPEAVSIWVELVESRKAHLRQGIEGDKFHLGDLTTSAIQIDRQQLAQAWLRSADTAYEKKQKQLMLIINNLGATLASGSDIYHIVVDAWKTAMSLMDKIVSGMPQSVELPELMLALSSWHLYPDMTLLHGKLKNIRQNDPLVTAGGIITLGLHNPNISKDLGITWSLPLSHLRYYGKPVMRAGTVGIKRSRVSMDELLFVTLGCVTNGWGSDSSNLDLLARFFEVLLGKFEQHKPPVTPPPWLEVLGKAAKKYRCLDLQAKKEAHRLAAFGRRRCSSFLAASKQHLPFAFNLSNPATFVHLIKGTESQIAWLRKIVLENITKERKQKLERAVIEYQPDVAENTSPPPIHWTQPDLEDHGYFRQKLSEYASLLPHQQTDESPLGYRRWIPSLPEKDLCQGAHLCSSEKYIHISTAAAERRLILEHSSKESCIIFTAFTEESSVSSKELPPPSTPPHKSAEPDTLLSALGQAKFNAVMPRSLQALSSKGVFKNIPSASSKPKIEAEAQRMLRITNNFLRESTVFPTKALDGMLDAASQRSNSSSSTEGQLLASTMIKYERRCCPYKWYVPKAIPQEQNPKGVRYSSPPPVTEHSVEYKLCFGLPPSIGIFLPVMDGDDYPSTLFPPKHLSEQDLIDIFESEAIDIVALDYYLSRITSSFWGSGYKDHLESLEALHFAAEIYTYLMDATIDLEVTSTPLNQYEWAKTRKSKWTRSNSFSCIATFESGNLNIYPSDLKDVMGISTGNSLYIAEYLWTDPYDSPSSYIIKRSIGNVGKPGLAFLISPTNPNMKEPDYSSWTNIPHEDFDGNCEGAFDKTSLHLSFTGYESSLNSNEHGLFDKQVYFLQAVVQVFDAGTWVADLDIVTALDGDFGARYLKRLPQARPKSNENSALETIKAEEESSQINRIGGVKIIGSLQHKNGSLLDYAETSPPDFCGHSPEEIQDFSITGKLTSIDCWDEIIDYPNNACIVRTNGDWLARLATAVVGLQKLRTVIIAPKKNVCWACVQRMNINSRRTMIIIC
ncbi:hypothetical protein OIDMADRAFT_30945 [Oidiodendron maius Zn]|uniref:Uncharacterized protein n=1 Tax=Oidiodendron maius (strain Zn) TaxID=913774 RepID=A0A0C3DBM3_OIDMZ|nr:hypothetical protein OIDMADRAFT_30945 [Oidiodendron maius Zn]